MLKSKKILLALVSLLTVITLAACAGNDESDSNQDEGMGNMDHSNMDMGSDTEENDDSKSEESMDMDHSGTGEVPEGLKVSENPTYKVGSKAIIKDAHMEGMEGAEATIVGAYDTVAYAISYTPTNGGEPVENHKWVIHEEIPDAGEQPLEPGTEVTINAEHMEGMDGAKAVIDSAEETTVYMIDFTPTTGGERVTNHQWVTESELSPVE